MFAKQETQTHSTGFVTAITKESMFAHTGYQSSDISQPQNEFHAPQKKDLSQKAEMFLAKVELTLEELDKDAEKILSEIINIWFTCGSD